MDWGSFLGGFFGGAVSAVIAEWFRRLSRREKYAEWMYTERLRAYAELHKALNSLLIDRDIEPLRRSHALCHLFSADVVAIVNDIFAAHKSGSDASVAEATSLLRRELFMPEIEKVYPIIFKGFAQRWKRRLLGILTRS